MLLLSLETNNMKTLAFSFSILLAATSFVACGDSSKVEREVGEEAADLVEAITPESQRAGDPAEVPAMISVEETIGAVTSAGGLLKLSPANATGVIDKWIESLRGNAAVDDSDLLVENLTKLKDLLMSPNIDGKKVSEVLENLARETKQAAEDSDNMMVKSLSDVLYKAAEQLD